MAGKVQSTTGVSQFFLNLVDSKWLSICYCLHRLRTSPPQNLTMSAP